MQEQTANPREVFRRRHLTVKLRGRAEAPDGAEGAQFLSARGAKPQAHHGPLQRLLDARLLRSTSSKAPSIQASKNNAGGREQHRAEQSQTQ
jgi:hypothetical protein